MKSKRYTYILYTIAFVTIVTIAIQVYWNYNNYLNNKQQLINDVQISLDKAVDDYYAALAERTTIGVFLEGRSQKNALEKGGTLDNFFKKIDSVDKKGVTFKSLDSFDFGNTENIMVLKGLAVDSMNTIKERENPTLPLDIAKEKIDSLKLNGEFPKRDDFEFLTSKIIVSITNDTLNVKQVDSFLVQEFARKNINIDHKLYYQKPEKKFHFPTKKKQPVKVSLRDSSNILFTSSKSSFLPKGSRLDIEFSNTTFTILKRSFGGILISLLLVSAVISCLFYLLKIIKRQKQLAEVKNDLISNITHEFKTPIATIGVALESINSFNAIDDTEKTKKYINMSSGQLEKLNLMVEKLLETATLDSESLNLNKEETDLIGLLQNLKQKYQFQNSEKTFQLQYNVEPIVVKVDPFHFENALNNILDNAVKYGGNLISIDATESKNGYQISVSDNGTNLTENQAKYIFEKFYRVPKGNTHDVKGFGIGLYYTKSIIEKHGGTITVATSNGLTTFKINIPNG